MTKQKVTECPLQSTVIRPCAALLLAATLLPIGQPLDLWPLLHNVRGDCASSTAQSARNMPRTWSDTDWWELDFWVIPITSYPKTFRAIILGVVLLTIVYWIIYSRPIIDEWPISE